MYPFSVLMASNKDQLNTEITQRFTKSLVTLPYYVLVRNSINDRISRRYSKQQIFKSDKFLSLYYYSIQHVRKVLLSRQKKKTHLLLDVGLTLAKQ